MRPFGCFHRLGLLSILFLPVVGEDLKSESLMLSVFSTVSIAAMYGNQEKTGKT